MGVLKQIVKQVRWEVRLGLDRLVDRYYSIDTVVRAPLPKAFESGQFDDGNVNGSTSYWILKYYLDYKGLGPEDVFYDVGCGHGRVLCTVARHRVAKCVGIELSTEFAAKARANAAALRGRVSPIEVHVGDAAQMDYADGTMFYFGDPFGADTMRAVLQRIGETVEARPRVVKCIFLLPTDQRSDPVRRVIETAGWLRLVSREPLPFSTMRIDHWASEPSQHENVGPSSPATISILRAAS